MVKESLFAGLPPPSQSAPQEQEQEQKQEPGQVQEKEPKPSPASAVKSALQSSGAGTKRSPVHSNDGERQGEKRVRFKEGVEANSEQVQSAMHRIASHISNPAKFRKASKLAVQLLEAGSVSNEFADPFFSILKAAMISPSRATDSPFRADYCALFSAVQEHIQNFTVSQQAQVEVWLLRAQLANELFTDDSFVFSKATGRVRQAIENLPDATDEESMLVSGADTPATSEQLASTADMEVPRHVKEEADPFGLNAFLPKLSKKEEKMKRTKEKEAAVQKASEDAGRLLRERREALISCLKISADRYKFPWAQTIIDITVKHAHDNLSKFTASQRDGIEALWQSVRDQQVRRKQGKTTSDITPFERLQAKYAVEKISIRKAVGSGGGRSAEQWLG